MIEIKKEKTPLQNSFHSDLNDILFTQQEFNTAPWTDNFYNKIKNTLNEQTTNIPEIYPLSQENIKDIKEIKVLLIEYFQSNSVREKFWRNESQEERSIDPPKQIIELLKWFELIWWKFNKIHFYSKENLQNKSKELNWGDSNVLWFTYDWEVYLSTQSSKQTIIHEFYHIISTQNNTINILNINNLSDNFVDKLKNNCKDIKKLKDLKEKKVKLSEYYENKLKIILENKKKGINSARIEKEINEFNQIIMNCNEDIIYYLKEIKNIEEYVFIKEEILARFFTLRLDLFKICGVKMWDEISIENIKKLKKYYEKNWYGNSYNILESINTDEDILELINLMNNKIVGNIKVTEEIRHTA